MFITSYNANISCKTNIATVEKRNAVPTVQYKIVVALLKTDEKYNVLKIAFLFWSQKFSINLTIKIKTGFIWIIHRNIQGYIMWDYNTVSFNKLHEMREEWMKQEANWSYLIGFMGRFILSDSNGPNVFIKFSGAISKPTQYGKAYLPRASLFFC